MRRPSPRRFPITAAIALGLHALGLAFFTTAPPPRVAPAPPPAPLLIEIDWTEDTPPPEPLKPAPAPPVTSSPAPAPKAKGRAARAKEPIVTVTGASEAPSSEPGPNTSEPIAAPPIVTGEGPAKAPPAPVPPPLLPRPLPASRAALGPLLDAGKTKTGLSATAQVVATVHRVAQSTDAPRVGHGILRIRVDERGAVSGISSTSPSWEKAARALLAALTGKKLHVPPGARGVVISFTVDAKITNVPAALTGDVKPTPIDLGDDMRGSSPSDKPPTTAVINPAAWLPVERRVLHVELLGEESL